MLQTLHLFEEIVQKSILSINIYIFWTFIYIYVFFL